MQDYDTGRPLRAMVAGSIVIALSMAAAGSAQADVAISKQPTQNMNCSDGVCTATAQKAVLNVTDLATMLAGGDVTVATGGLARDIEISAALSWTSTSRLTLDAQQSVMVKKPVTVAGTGALTITTNEGGHGGDFIIEPKGSIQFWDLSSSLVIEGHGYTLVGDIATLAADIAIQPLGFYALAKNYDASADGTYSSSPIPTTFGGVFEGLGNRISNLTINFVANGQNPGGFFASVDSDGRLRDVGLARVDLEGVLDWNVGPLAGVNDGHVTRAWTTGIMNLVESGSQHAGGLIGGNTGVISDSHADVKMYSREIGNSYGGGLVGINVGAITSSYSEGSITYIKSTLLEVGGLVGLNDGIMENSYTLDRLLDGRADNDNNFGGLVGENDSNGQVISSYAAGKVRRWDHTVAGLGGLIGVDNAAAGHIATSYWDLDFGISDPSQGAGNIKNDPGIMGLTTEQLQSGLPQGFDPKIWSEDAMTNQGLPYLVVIPPN